MNKERLNEFKASLLTFVVKVLVLVVILVVALDVYMPGRQDMQDLAQRVLTERNKLYLLGFVQNPAALYMTSEIAEKQGFLDSARRDMELAVGLVDLHAADKRSTKRYYDRLEALKSKTGEIQQGKQK